MNTIKSFRNGEPVETKFIGWGDKVERAVKPLAKLIKSKCLDENGQLKSGSPCRKMRDRLNKIGAK